MKDVYYMHSVAILILESRLALEKDGDNPLDLLHLIRDFSLSSSQMRLELDELGAVKGEFLQQFIIQHADFLLELLHLRPTHFVLAF